MKPASIELNEFYVIGVSVRTTNQNGQSQIDIGELWGQFIGQSLIEKISNKVTRDIYCIYTDYESDFYGPYTTILGCKVASFKNIPEGFVSKTIPATKYLLYKSEGKLPDCVAETWSNIWKSDTNRKYIADFDIYGQQAQNSENALVDTYLSV